MKNSRGMTLVEVVVASAILVVLVSMTFLIMNQSADDTTQNAKKLDLDHVSREVLNEIAREVRMGSIDHISEGAGSTAVVPAANEAAAPEYDNLRFQMLNPEDFDLQRHSWATVGDPQNANQPNPDHRWSRRVWYRWVRDVDELDNEMDDDNDGLIDEGRIEKTEEAYALSGGGGYTWQTTSTTIICDNVPEDSSLAPGSQIGWLKFKVVQPRFVKITLRLEVVDPKTSTKDSTTGRVKTFQKTASTTIELRNDE